MIIKLNIKSLCTIYRVNTIVYIYCEIQHSFCGQLILSPCQSLIVHFRLFMWSLSNLICNKSVLFIIDLFILVSHHACVIEYAFHCMQQLNALIFCYHSSICVFMFLCFYTALVTII